MANRQGRWKLRKGEGWPARITGREALGMWSWPNHLRIGVLALDHWNDLRSFSRSAATRWLMYHREWKGQQQPLEQRDQEALRDTHYRTDELELGDLVHQIDQIHALFAVPIALVNGVDTDMTRPPIGLRGLAQTDAQPLASWSISCAWRDRSRRRAEDCVGNRCHRSAEPNTSYWRRRISRVAKPDIERLMADVRAAVLARKRSAAAATDPIGLAPLPENLLARKAGQKLQHHPLVPLAERHVAEAHQRFPNEGVDPVILGMKGLGDEGTKCIGAAVHSPK